MIKLFDFFNCEAENILAAELVAHIVKNIPPKIISDRREILSVNKVSRLLEQAFERAQEHQEKKGIGFVKRAFLANKFKWGLMNHNYPHDFISVATEGLIVALTKNKKI